MSIFGEFGGKRIFDAAVAPATMWLTRNGPTQALASSNWTWDVGLEYNNAIYIIGKHSVATLGAYCWKYTPTTGWVQQNSTAINGEALTKDDAYCFFVDSRGYLYVSFLEDAVAGNIYRSTDDGVTWVSVQALANTTNGTYVWSMTESDNGYVFAAAYRGNAPTDGTAVALYRSTDGGASFTDISGNMNEAGRKHIHDVYYCPHRRILLVAPGDLGANDKIQYSSDYGNTFTPWTASPGQTISITSDSQYIYFAVEITAGDNSSIYRASGVDATPEQVVVSTNAMGLAWQAHVNDFGQVCFLYATTTIDKARFWVSSDHGETWFDAYPSASAVADKTHYQARGRVSYYAGRPHFFYNTYKQWRAFPAKHTFEIDEVGGSNYLFSSGPFNTIPDNGGLQGKVKLIANYAGVYTPGTTGLVVDKNGYAFSSVEAGTLAVDEGFEGVGAPAGSTTSTDGATFNYDSTAQVRGGAQSLSITTTGSFASLRYSGKFTGLAADAVAWLSGWLYMDIAAAPASAVTIMSNGAFNLQVYSAGYLQATSAAGSVGTLRQLSNAISFPLQQWVHVKMAVKRSATAGFVKVWQHGVLVLEAVGVNTSTSVTYGNADYSNTANLTPDLVVYWDDIKASINFDPDKPTSPVLRGSRQVLLPEGIRS
jgi:hypothetical protein